jgi:mRNA interferase RelE/StbE
VAWTVVWTERALREAECLDRRARERVVTAVERFAETEHGDVKRLQGVDPPAWRLRVGDYRVLFEFVHATGELRVQRVAPARGLTGVERPNL